MKRRDFIRKSVVAASGTWLAPEFLKLTGRSIGSGNQNILVVIQLSGGNDGLNTVIPYRNDIYYRERPVLAIERPNVIALNDEIGLNPALTLLRNLYDDGRVRIINNVGYPNPDRSHFRSMDIWQTASKSTEYLNTGWLGRYLDAQCRENGVRPYQMLEIDDTLSLAMKGSEANGLALLNPRKLYSQARFAELKKLVKANEKQGVNSTVDYLYKTIIETESSAAYLHEKVKVRPGSNIYPNSELAKNLKTISELINSGVETSVYYVSLSGFDTHVNQKNQQERLLQQYSEGISAFVTDLKKNGQLGRTLILTFSEFGRRVKQNASGGTDHGTANNVFLIGGPPRNSVVYNEAPDLSDLDAGDLRFSVDFRNIYASLLKDWLGGNAKAILGERFSGLSNLV
ncbi:hypothetical protein DYBT9275_03190 [Dyadobacter sp. CECT 9275]|uniref:DUF1501 domain-containing protein n=1 Tax=Dyadobacter helix TaxID=2822344 RepID=A0A916NM04_9BACT|nr:DUF1501 domain-containing protein [Dyadobacter sp. CECT 9275]CAG5003605.1 hypothetical protein DYBT9275_03190 [Dyadobacter sp. CECT 9275]